jgi:hypothetical protein
VSDDDLVGGDENVFDEQPQDALTFRSGRSGALVFQSGHEVLDVVSQGGLDRAVGELGVEGIALLAQIGFPAAQTSGIGARRG